MFAQKVKFLCLLAALSVHAAPTAPLDTATLLANGEAAQTLNAQFSSLKVTDACQTGETACVEGLPAQCVNDKWKTQKCSGGNQCFAIPNVRSNGTILSCTNPVNAASIIDATGAQGGLASNSTSNDTDPSDASSATSTVTVTVLLTPGATITSPTETQTIDPQEASSILASASQASVSASATIASSPAAVTSIAGNAVTSSSAASASSTNSASATVIQLTRASSSSSQPTPASAFVAPAAAPPTITLISHVRS